MAISSVTPKTSQCLLSARTVVRIVGPDKIMQQFRLDNEHRMTKQKKNFPKNYPKLYDIIISVIVHKTSAGIEKCISALGRHFSKCADRRLSKEFLNSSTCSAQNIIVNESSSDTDDNDDTDLISETSDQL